MEVDGRLLINMDSSNKSNQDNKKKKLHQERKEIKTYINVNQNGSSIGVFSTLKKACEEMKIIDKNVFSYWD